MDKYEYYKRGSLDGEVICQEIVRDPDSLQYILTRSLKLPEVNKGRYLAGLLNKISYYFSFSQELEGVRRAGRELDYQQMIIDISELFTGLDSEDKEYLKKNSYSIYRLIFMAIPFTDSLQISTFFIAPWTLRDEEKVNLKKILDNFYEYWQENVQKDQLTKMQLLHSKL